MPGVFHWWRTKRRGPSAWDSGEAATKALLRSGVPDGRQMIYNQAITEAARRADLAFLSPGREFLSRWFGLSYAAWLTMPRVLMEAMPDEWQGKMAALLSEYDAAFPNQPDLGTRVFVTRGGRLVKTPDWLINYRRPDVGKVDELRGSDVAGKEQL